MPEPWPDGRQSMMIEPSLLFSEHGIEWVRRSLETDVELVVPSIVYEWLGGVGDLDPSLLLAPEDAEMFEANLAAIGEFGPDVLRSFNHRQAAIDSSAQLVANRLLASEDPAANTWADEWAYLQSHSWLAAKLRRCLDAFEAAGAAVVEFGKEVGIDLIEEVIPPEHLPRSIDAEVILRATAKWMVVGGSHALGGTVGSIAGAAVGGPVGVVIGEKLGGFVGEELATKAVLAIDP